MPESTREKLTKPLLKDHEVEDGQVHRHEGKFYLDGVEIQEDAAIEAGWQPDPEEKQPDIDMLATDEEMSEGRKAVLEASKSDKAAKEMDPIDRVDAVEWFLSDDPNEAPAQRKLEIDVSTDPDHPKVMEWVVQALERETIQSIRNKAKSESVGRKARREGVEGEPDVALANARIAAAGTVYPNMKDPAIRGKYLDPADALKHRFRNKSGIIDQLAGHIIEVSGYDDESVKEVVAVGNS